MPEKEYIVKLTKIRTQEFTITIPKKDATDQDNAADDAWETFNRIPPIARTEYKTEVREIYKKQP